MNTLILNCSLIPHRFYIQKVILVRKFPRGSWQILFVDSHWANPVIYLSINFAWLPICALWVKLIFKSDWAVLCRPDFISRWQLCPRLSRVLSFPSFVFSTHCFHFSLIYTLPSAYFLGFSHTWMPGGILYTSKHFPLLQLLFHLTPTVTSLHEYRNTHTPGWQLTQATS